MAVTPRTLWVVYGAGSQEQPVKVGCPVLCYDLKVQIVTELHITQELRFVRLHLPKTFPIDKLPKCCDENFILNPSATLDQNFFSCMDTLFQTGCSEKFAIFIAEPGQYFTPHLYPSTELPIQERTSNFLLSPKSVYPSIEHALPEMYKDSVLLSGGRENFVKWFVETARLLDDGKLKGVGRCTALMGARGIGKTYLLKCLCEAASMCMKNTYICWMDIKNSGIRCTPAEEALHLLNKQFSVRSEDTLDHLQKTLLQMGDKKIIFIVDEIDCVFSSHAQEALLVISQLIAMAKTDGRRRISAIVTGSLPQLHQLLFCHLPESQRSKFPAYTGMNFNDRKFTAYHIPPIAWLADIHLAIKAIDPTKLATSADVTVEMLLQSRGNMQMLTYILTDQQTELKEARARWKSRYTARGVQSIWCSLLLSMELPAIELVFEKLARPCVDAAPMLPVVTFYDLKAKYDPRRTVSEPELDMNTLWDLYDMQFISLTKSEDDYVVGFLHVADLRLAYDHFKTVVETTTWQNQVDRPLHADEKACLLHPSGTTKHEKLLAETIAFSYNGAPHSERLFSFSHRTVSLALTSPTTKRDAYVDIANPEIWTGELFQLLPDDYGTDLIAVFDRNPPSGDPPTASNFTRAIEIWLFQCKMADKPASCLTKDQVKAINKRFTAKKQDLYDHILRAHQGIEITDVHVIVTTRYLSEDVLPAVKSLNYILIGRTDLAKMWTPRIRAFLQTAPQLQFMLSARHLENFGLSCGEGCLAMDLI